MNCLLLNKTHFLVIKIPEELKELISNFVLAVDTQIHTSPTNIFINASTRLFGFYFHWHWKIVRHPFTPGSPPQSHLYTGADCKRKTKTGYD